MKRKCERPSSKKKKGKWQALDISKDVCSDTYWSLLSGIIYHFSVLIAFGNWLQILTCFYTK